MIPLTVPELGLPLGEEIVVSCWLVRRGDEIVAGDRVVELLIGEMTFDISAPASGRLVKVACEIDDPVQPGMVLGQIRPDFEED